MVPDVWTALPIFTFGVVVEAIELYGGGAGALANDDVEDEVVVVFLANGFHQGFELLVVLEQPLRAIVTQTTITPGVFENRIHESL